MNVADFYIYAARNIENNFQIQKDEKGERIMWIYMKYPSVTCLKDTWKLSECMARWWQENVYI
jgi:hypothetical protein